MNIYFLWILIIFFYILLLLPTDYSHVEIIKQSSVDGPDTNKANIDSIYEEIQNYSKSWQDIADTNKNKKVFSLSSIANSGEGSNEKLEPVNIKPIYNINFCKNPHPLEDKMINIEGPLFPGSKGMNGVEKICKTALEVYFNKPFIHTRQIEWLKNPRTGHALELDCYNEKLGVAVEYQGPTHYIWPNRYQNTPQSRYAFDLALERDEVKKILCKENNVVLVEVPYEVDNSLIPRFIFNSFDSLGYKAS